MSDNTKIEWADATLNYANGCTVLSAGCTNCYAMKQAHRFPVRQGLTVQSKGGMVWTGEVRLNDKALHQALAWKRGRKIFWNAHGDLFHDAVPDAAIDKLFAVCALTPQHTHMILTKRSARMREYMVKLIAMDANERDTRFEQPAFELTDAPCVIGCLEELEWPLPNVWLGVSAEDQQRWDERTDDLLQTPSAVRFVSAEPLLGPIIGSKPADRTYQMLSEWYGPDGFDESGSQPRVTRQPGYFPLVDWVIAGGESGPGARPMHPDWVRSLRDQCAAAGVAFHFKQWGEWAPVSEMAEDLIDGIYHAAPEQRPEASRRCKVDQCVLHADGARFDGRAMIERGAFEQGSRAMTMFAVGKKRAGRLLDGVTHDEFPA